MKIFVFAVALLSHVLPVQAGSVWLIMKEAVSIYAIDVEKLEMVKKVQDTCKVL